MLLLRFRLFFAFLKLLADSSSVYVVVTYSNSMCFELAGNFICSCVHGVHVISLNFSGF